VIADGNVLGDETVASGAITFDRASTSTYEVGLPYTVEVKTMPVAKDIGTGTRLAFKKRIVEVNAVLNESQHLTINNILVPIRAFDTVGTLDNPTASFSGIKNPTWHSWLFNYGTGNGYSAISVEDDFAWS